jgi:hypothetical protein
VIAAHFMLNHAGAPVYGFRAATNIFVGAGAAGVRFTIAGAVRALTENDPHAA